mmetsp:Transcript_5434/g.9389  ORF Transcript_5434/g.9389 Transcript_5434/m.9389 type:complete len:220 (+) Transcript_5434:1224-1883(+)
MGTPLSNARSTSTSVPSRYSSNMSVKLIHSPALPASPLSSSGSPSMMAPATMRALLISDITRAYAACSSCRLLTRMTPMEAAPLTGLITEGNPTCSPAFFTSARSEMRKCLGVGSPAASMICRVLCLSRAASTESGVLCGRPSFSASRTASGTASSQKVRIPSSSPTSAAAALMPARQSSNTLSESPKSMGTNLAIVPSFSNSCTQLSGPSNTMHFTPS